MAEESVFGGQRRLHFFQRSGSLVRSFLLATEDHGNPSFRIELDHHVRALIGDPDVVRRIDFDCVRIRPGIQIMADLAQKFAVSIELQKLRRAGAIRRSGGIPAGEHKNVPFGVHSDTGNFAEV